MTNTQAADSVADDDRPKVVGLVRKDVSRLDTPRHAIELRRHAERLGYRYLYTVRPLVDAPDPVGYALGIAAGLDVAAIMVYDLRAVDDRPERVCEKFDLETFCPATTWVRTADVVSSEGAA
jgi:hypothetical protein